MYEVLSKSKNNKPCFHLKLSIFAAVKGHSGSVLHRGVNIIFCRNLRWQVQRAREYIKYLTMIPASGSSVPENIWQNI